MAAADGNIECLVSGLLGSNTSSYITLSVSTWRAGRGRGMYRSAFVYIQQGLDDVLCMDDPVCAGCIWHVLRLECAATMMCVS